MVTGAHALSQCEVMSNTIDKCMSEVQQRNLTSGHDCISYQQSDSALEHGSPAGVIALSCLGQLQLPSQGGLAAH